MILSPPIAHRRARKVLATLVAGGLVAASIGLTATTAQATQADSVLAPTASVAAYDGETRTWTVPAGVTSVRATITGAAGGHGGGSTRADGVAGRGSIVQVVVPVSPGEVLTLVSAKRGEDGGNNIAAGGTGWKPGANGGNRGVSASVAKSGGGGGGASALLQGSMALVVGAGGGGGGGKGGISGQTGGAGGSNSNGSSGTTPIGDASAGGIMGDGGSTARQGGAPGAASAGAGGGGGGAGWNGGGGGKGSKAGGSTAGGGGGGAGTSYRAPFLVAQSVSAAPTFTAGSVFLIWDVPPAPLATLSVSVDPAVAYTDEAQTVILGHSNPGFNSAGWVTVSYNGEWSRTIWMSDDSFRTTFTLPTHLPAGDGTLSAIYTPGFGNTTAVTATANFVRKDRTAAIDVSATDVFAGEHSVLSFTTALDGFSEEGTYAIAFDDAAHRSFELLTADATQSNTYQLDAINVAGPVTGTIQYTDTFNRVSPISSFSFQVDSIATTTTIDAPQSHFGGLEIEVHATVTAAVDAMVAGSVEIRDGSDVVASGPVNAGSYNTAITLPTDGANLTAHFIPDGSKFLASNSSTIAVEATLAPTEIELSSPPSVLRVDESITFTATLSAAHASDYRTPSGEVTLNIGGDTTGAIVMTDNGHGIYSANFVPTVAGSYAFSASYAGSNTHAASASTELTAGTAAWYVSLTGVLAPQSVVEGESATLTATATALPASLNRLLAALLPSLPTVVGDVQLLIDGTPVGDPIALVDGSAPIPVPGDLAVGTYQLSARYLPPTTGQFAATESGESELAVTARTIPTPQPTVEPTPQPTVEPTPQPTVEPTPQPTVEPTPQPTVEPTPQPTVEPTPQPTAPTVDPTEPTSEPTDKPVEPTTTATPTVPSAGTPTSQPKAETPTLPATGAPGDLSALALAGFALLAFGMIASAMRRRRRA